MNSKIQQAIIGGIVATIVMTLVMFIAPMMGMPKMSPPKLLGAMMGFSVTVGWIMHFMIGIILALLYAYIFLPLLKGIGNNTIRGGVFGIIAFILALVVMMLMVAIIGEKPPMQGSMAMIIMGAVTGHIIFGIIVALFVKPQRVVA